MLNPSRIYAILISSILFLLPIKWQEETFTVGSLQLKKKTQKSILVTIVVNN